MGMFQDKLRSMAFSFGVDLFGAADLTVAKDFVLVQGGQHMASFPWAISLGIRLLDAIVDELFRHEEPTALFSYRGLYNTVNASLDRVALMIAKKVQENGFRAYPIPASQTVNPRKLEGAISHKLAANLAGLGWIGKNCLLITPQYGPRVRFTTVLTDAPLDIEEQIPNGCGDCVQCVNICPMKAFTGVTFNSSEPRDVRFRAHLCNNYSQRREKLLGEGLCGLCVYICPFGRKHLSNQARNTKLKGTYSQTS